MRDRMALVVYLGTLVCVTMVHNSGVLALILLVTVLAARRDAFRLAKRAVTAVALFNTVVTVSYCVIALARGQFSIGVVILLNLRVVLLTFLTFLFGARVNPLRALSFSRPLSHLFTLTYSQLLTFRRLFEDFRLAFRSRTITHVGVRDRYRHSAAMASFFLRRALSDATEVTQAMNSRGFFDAQG
jgi:cobalt/nickel transport system permease protein